MPSFGICKPVVTIITKEALRTVRVFVTLDCWFNPVNNQYLACILLTDNPHFSR